MPLAFLAFGLFAAMTHALLYGIMLLTEHGLNMLVLIPGFYPIATLLQASGYIYANAAVPGTVLAAIAPFNIGLTAAVDTLPALVAGATMLSLGNRQGFGGVAGFLRGLFVLIATFAVVFCGLVALACYLARIGV